MLNTGAGADRGLVSFGAVGAKVKIGSLELAGEGRNFAFLGDGSFRTKNNFGVFLGIGGATGDSFKWPSFLPIKIDAIGIQWAQHPGRTRRTSSSRSPPAITGLQGVSGLEFTRLDPGRPDQRRRCCCRARCRSRGIDSLGVTVKGSMFGGKIEAGIVGGILRLDADYNIIGTLDNTTPVNQRVFFLGLQGGFSMAGMAGFTIRVGLSELGPLSAFISVELPGGILLEPFTGLTINDFSAGVEFFKTLPSIEDPFAAARQRLRAPDRADRRRVAQRPPAPGRRCRPRRSTRPGPERLHGRVHVADDDHRLGAKIYSIYTSQEVFNGQVIVKISTDGKFLIVGKLNFAADQVSISGRLYADLSQVASGKRHRPVPRRRARPGPAAHDLRQAQDGLQERLGRGGRLRRRSTLPADASPAAEADRHPRRPRLGGWLASTSTRSPAAPTSTSSSRPRPAPTSTTARSSTADEFTHARRHADRAAHRFRPRRPRRRRDHRSPAGSRYLPPTFGGNADVQALLARRGRRRRHATTCAAGGQPRDDGC